MKDIRRIQEENRELILKTIHGVSYEEALKKEEGYNCHYIYSTPYGDLELVGDAKCYGYNREKHHPNAFVKKIIGKSITLSRVLLAFQRKWFLSNVEIHALNQGLVKITIIHNDDQTWNDFFWNLEIETLEKQSEKTQRSVWGLLTKNE